MILLGQYVNHPLFSTVITPPPVRTRGGVRCLKGGGGVGSVLEQYLVFIILFLINCFGFCPNNNKKSCQNYFDKIQKS